MTPAHTEFVRYDQGCDTGYLIDFFEVNEFVHEFNVYEAVDLKDDGIQMQDDSGMGQSWTTSRENAEVYAEGNIRFDGCMNLSFYPADHCMLHLCGPGQADEFAWLIKQIYGIANQINDWPHLDAKVHKA